MVGRRATRAAARGGWWEVGPPPPLAAAGPPRLCPFDLRANRAIRVGARSTRFGPGRWTGSSRVCLRRGVRSRWIGLRYAVALGVKERFGWCSGYFGQCTLAEIVELGID